jgi:hypothetical protein
MKHIILFTALVLATTGCSSDEGAAGGGSSDAAQAADAAGGGDTTGSADASGGGDAASSGATTSTVDGAATGSDASTEEDGGGEPDSDAGPTADVVTPVDPANFCESIGQPVRPFEVEGDFGTGRHQKADDFTFPRFDGSTWTLSEAWTGCDSYVFIGSAKTNSGLDDTSIWERDLQTLITTSPDNVHYFFVPTRSQPEAMVEVTAMAARVDEVLGLLTAEDAAHWAGRLHVAGGHVSALGSWLTNLLGTGYGGYYGAAIDRRQEVRYMGNFADVTRYNQGLADAGEWMWEANMAYAAHEARHFNYEVERDAYLASQTNATVLRPFDKEVFGGGREVEVTFPDAATMATFDTLEFDLTMDCPDPDGGEFGNCGAWDYLSYIYLQEVDEAGEVTWRQMARFITTYHREGRYLVDATPMLVFLAEGGARTLKVDVSGQTYMTTLDIRLRDADTGARPAEAHYLFSGGGFNSAYSDKYEPIDIQIPESAARVEVWAIITGHGMNTYNCAEFCDHRHTFTVGGEYFQKGHPEVNSNQGCMGQIENGMIPNQGGTWWFGRGGWCPGQQVDPWTADVTEVVTPGETTTISYQGTLGSLTPPDGAGNIRMVSYLVIYE